MLMQSISSRALGIANNGYPLAVNPTCNHVVLPPIEASKLKDAAKAAVQYCVTLISTLYIETLWCTGTAQF